MRTAQLWISLIALVVGFALLAAGALLVGAHFTPFFEELLFHFLSHSALFFGGGMVMTGVLLLFLCLRLNQRRYLLFQMGGIAVADRLLAQLATQKLQTLFPGQLVECDIALKRKGKIEIMANIPYVSEEKQAATLRSVETLLETLLREQCRMEKEFIFNVGFLPSHLSRLNC